MEHPATEIEDVIFKLTTGSPRLQQQTLEHYFTPNASFSHPFCAVKSNRDQILSIFRWYKVLSPKIEIQVNGISYEEARQKLYIDISQTFRLWPAIPLGYRADVNLVTVLQLTSDRSGRDKTAEQATNTSPFTENGAVKPATTLATQPGKYWIKSQTDLYQTTEFAKFASLLGLLPLLVSLWHMLATYCCVLGAIVFAPFSQAWQRYTDREVEHRAKVRSSPAFGPNFGGDGTAEGRARERQLDIWELEAKYLNGGLHDASKMEGLKMNIKTSLKMDSGRQQPGGASQGASLEWMKMEKSRP